MIACWFVKGDWSDKNDAHSTERFAGVVTTNDPATLPTVGQVIPGGKKIAAIRNITLLVELDKDKLDFFVDTTLAKK